MDFPKSLRSSSLTGVSLDRDVSILNFRMSVQVFLMLQLPASLVDHTAYDLRYRNPKALGLGFDPGLLLLAHGYDLSVHDAYLMAK